MDICFYMQGLYFAASQRETRLMDVLFNCPFIYLVGGGSQEFGSCIYAHLPVTDANWINVICNDVRRQNMFLCKLYQRVISHFTPRPNFPSLPHHVDWIKHVYTHVWVSMPQSANNRDCIVSLVLFHLTIMLNNVLVYSAVTFPTFYSLTSGILARTTLRTLRSLLHACKVSWLHFHACDAIAMKIFPQTDGKMNSWQST